MHTIVFIGCNKSGTSREALKLSAERGYYTVLFTNREKFLNQREEFSEVDEIILLEDLLNKEKLYCEIKKLENQGKSIRGCISLIDPFVHLAATLSEELGLVQLSTDALYLMEDKTRFREKMKHHPATPQYKVFRPEQDTLSKFVDRYQDLLPLIVKSPVSNGSKDVIFTETKEQLRNGLRNLLYSNPQHPILIEEYLEGPQYLVEVLVYKGKIHIIGIIKQEIAKLTRFIVTDYSFPAVLTQDNYRSLENTVYSIVTTLGLTNGTCHLEIRLVKGEWKLIEINPRMSGGAMNRIIYEGTGIDLVNETLNLYLGKEPNVQQQYQRFVYVKYLVVNKRGRLLKVTGKNRASNYSGIKDVYIKPRKGNILVPPLSMGDRYAYVLSSADNPDEAKEIAISAAKEIRFYIEPF